jgi:serine/threonine-protein kinase HipA
MNDSVERVSDAVLMVARQVGECAARFPAFREIAKRMPDAWAHGIDDIQSRPVPGKSKPGPVPEGIDLSAARDKLREKEKNPHANYDGPFAHRLR